MSSKRSCFATPVSTLLPVLLRCGDFSVAVMRTLVLLLTFKGVAPLVIISKEIYSAKIILFQAPKEWINNDEVRMMFSAMLGTTNSQWKRRIDTSLVETLMLGVNRENERHKTNIVILTWFRSLENKFPNLLSLNLTGCINLTDASVSEVARRCSKLHTLNLRGCYNITDASVLEVARQGSNLQSLNLAGCNITDASVVAVARGCSNLQSLGIRTCRNITDASVSEVARRCLNLHTLDLNMGFQGNNNITDLSVLEVARHCSNLQTLNLGSCRRITDLSVMEVVRRCLNIQSLLLYNCPHITSACKNTLRQCQIAFRYKKK